MKKLLLLIFLVPLVLRAQPVNLTNIIVVTTISSGDTVLLSRYGPTMLTRSVAISNILASVLNNSTFTNIFVFNLNGNVANFDTITTDNLAVLGLAGTNQLVYIDDTGALRVIPFSTDGSILVQSAGGPGWTDTLNFDQFNLTQPIPMDLGGSGSVLLVPATNAVWIYDKVRDSNVLATLSGLSYTNGVLTGSAGVVNNGPFTNSVIYGNEFITNAVYFGPSGLYISNAIGSITNASGSVNATVDVTANNNVSARNTLTSQVRIGNTGPGVLGGISFGANTNAYIIKTAGGTLYVGTNLAIGDHLTITNSATIAKTNIAGINADGKVRPLTIGTSLSLNTNGTLESFGENFTLIQLSDPHVGFSAWTSNGLVDAIDWIIAEKTNQNIKMVISPGDMVDINVGTLTNNWTFLTNQFWRLRNAGISVFAVPGNHEGDDATWGTGGSTNYDIYLGTNFFSSDPAFITNRIVGSSRSLVFAQTNSGVPLVFVGLDYPTGVVASVDWTNIFYWANARFDQFSNSLGIVVMHEFLTQSGELANEFDTLWGGQGYWAWTNLAKVPNLVQAMSGHFRGTTATRELVGIGGNSVYANFFNCQEYANQGNKMIRVYNWDVAKRKIHARTFDATAKVYLAPTNMVYEAHTFGFPPDFYFPFQNSGGNKQYMTLFSNPDTKNFAPPSGIMDTYITFSGFLSDGNRDFWSIGRTNTSTDLQLKYGTNWTVAANPVVATFAADGKLKFPNQNGPFTNTITYGDADRSNAVYASAVGLLVSNGVGSVTINGGTATATDDLVANDNITARNTLTSQVKIGAAGPGVLGGITIGANENAYLIKYSGGVLAAGTNLAIVDNLILTNSATSGQTNLAGINADGVVRKVTIGSGLSLAANGTLSSSGGAAATFNDNQFTSLGGTTNIKSGAIVTNLEHRATLTLTNSGATGGSVNLYAGGSTNLTTILMTGDSLLFAIDGGFDFFMDSDGNLDIGNSITISDSVSGDDMLLTASTLTMTSTNDGKLALLSQTGTAWSSNRFQVDTIAQDNALRVSTNGITYGTFSGDGSGLTGIQTPWTSDINAATFAITNMAGTSNANAISKFNTNGINFENNTLNLAWGGTNIAMVTNKQILLTSGSTARPTLGTASDADATGSGINFVANNLVDIICNNGIVGRFSSASLDVSPALVIDSVVTLDTEAAGSLQHGADSATPVAQTIKGPDGSGSNIGGGAVTIGAGRATGTGAAGVLHFAVSTNNLSSGSVQNSLSNVVSIGSSSRGLELTNRATFYVFTNDFALGTRYTNGVSSGFSHQRATVMASFQLTAAAAGTAKVTCYAENAGGTRTNKLTISAGPLASLVTIEPVIMKVDPGAAFYFTDETSGTGASVVIVSGTSSYFGE